MDADTNAAGRGEPDVVPPVDLWGDPGDQVPPAGDDDEPGGGRETDRAATLIAQGAGRRLARDLGISDYQARALLAARRNGGGGS